MRVDKDKESKTSAAALRRSAEKQLPVKSQELQPRRTMQETQRLVHELEVHQIELEMQNRELRLARDDLQSAEISYRRLFETTRNGLLILDSDTSQIIDVNPYLLETLGYAREELLGKKIREIGAFVNIDMSKENLARLQQLEYLRHENHPLITRDGRQIFVEFVSNVYQVADKKLIQCSIHDISNHKKAEEIIEKLNTDLAARAAELEAANQELEAFNYSVAHDLRNPLNVICSCCQVIKELCGDMLDAQCSSYLQDAYDGTLRMNRLIEALLNFSRLGQVEPRREMVDLGGLANEIITLLKMAGSERHVDFRTIGKIVGHGDSSLLRIVLENLLGNAWKFTGTREKAVIEFCVTEAEGETVYIVRDNGIGFNMADVDKLFVPFQRLPGAEECRGSGIGLATVARIIRRHKGKIWAEGESGKGATFCFTLPENLQ